MAGTKFQYDESGTTFYYFLLSFLSLIIIPTSFYCWPRTSPSSNTNEDESESRSKKKSRCYCDPCVAKHNFIQSKESTFRPKLIKIVIIVSWIILAVFAYKVALIKPDYVNYDPFEILGISPGASKTEIKKAYHVLSLVHHPDKETGDAKRFMLISKAYAALTDETARKNWEEYGNPDGPGAMSFGIALPSWIVEKENSVFVLLVYVLLLMIALPIGVGIWWSNSSKYGGGFKVLMDTSQLYYFYIHKTPSMILRRVLMVIAASFEFHREQNSEIVERPSDNHEIPQLIKEMPNAFPNNKEAPLYFPYSIKARALIYAHLHRIPLPPNTLDLDRKYILTKLPYLLQEFVQCGAQMTLLAKLRKTSRTPSLETIENTMKLHAFVIQAMWTNKNALLQLPHVSEDMLRHFINRKRNIRSLQQLAELDEYERRQMLRTLTDEQYTDVLNFLGQLPLLNVAFRCEVLGDDDGDAGKITAGALVTVTVELTRREMSTLFTSNLSNDNKENVSPLNVDDDELEDDPDQPLKTQPQQQQQPTKKVWEKQSKGKSKKGAKNNKKNKAIQRKNMNRNRTGTAAKGTTQTPAGPNSEDEADEHGDASSDENGPNEATELKPNGTVKKQLKNDGDGGSGASSDDEGGNQVSLDDNDDDDDDWDKSDDAPSVPKKKEIFQTISKISHSVHCPYFPEDKQEHWWIYITERKTNSLITVPYFMTNLVDKEEVELKFTAPWKPGPYGYQVNVRCDSYVDLDYLQPLKIFVREAPKEIKTHPQWEISDEEDENEDDDDSAVSDSDLVESDDDDDNGKNNDDMDHNDDDDDGEDDDDDGLTHESDY